MTATPYTFGDYTATPGYEFYDESTGQAVTAQPAGATSPNGAPLTPGLMRESYGLGTYTDVNGVYTYNYGLSFNGIKGDGSGQTIAIVDAGSDPDIATDLQTFDTYWDLPAPPSFQQLSQTGSTTLPGVDQGWPGEISLDVEWAHVMAPGANIILFASSDLYAGVVEAASYPGVSVVSQSFGISGDPPNGDYVTPAGHSGVSFFAATGDSGGNVGSPAESPNVVAVGGTSLYPANSGAYGSETTWSAGGGGISTDETQPAYQTGIVSAWSTTQRTIPDISMDADPGTGVGIVDSYDSGSAAPWELIIGGTSLATPLTAATMSIADQARVSEGLTTLDSSTQMLPRLYELSLASYSTNYHDITTGNNTHPSTVGYDLGTGLGSPQAANLIPDLAGGGTVTGRAFIDTNGDGLYTAGTDTPMAGKTVYLDLSGSGAQTPQDPTATTNASGQYTFTDVIGSIHGDVRLVGATGLLQEPVAKFTTAYDTSETYNIIYTTSTATFVATAALPTATTTDVLGVTLNGTTGTGLSYTWSLGSGPAGGTPTFSPNGTAASQNTTVTFNRAGTYQLTVTASNAAGQVATSSVTVVVNQIIGSLAVNQVAAGITAGQSTQLSVTADDQFGNLIVNTPAVSWSVVSGGGTVSPGGVYTAPASGTLATVKAASGAVSATGTVGVVSAPYTAVDIGNLANNGQAYDSNGTVTISDSSDDIWGTSDDFLFDYQLLPANTTITAKLNSETSGSGYIKAGLMIRNSLLSSDVMAMEVGPPTDGSASRLEYRSSNGASAVQTNAVGSASVPIWLRLVDNGSTVTGYSSTDGVNFTQTGTEALTTGTSVYVGFALTSHDTSHLATAVFTNVSIVTTQVLSRIVVTPSPTPVAAGASQQLLATAYDTNGLPMAVQPAITWTLASGAGSITSAGVYTAPSTGGLATVTATSGTISGTGTVTSVKSPWTSTDIGNVSAPGTAYDSATTTTLTDTSDDIWNSSDDFHFDYQTLTGNGSITAELNSQTTTGGNFTKAGLMIRNSLSPGDAMAMVLDAPGGAPFEWRTTAGGTATQVNSSTNYGTPYWFRLTRNGSTITAYSSPNGTTWTSLGSQVIPMNQTVFVGMALSSHSTTTAATAVFSNVTISNPTVATAAAASPSPVTGKTTALSVLGANTPNASGETSLTYTWTPVTVPAGAAAPTFSVNGSNAAKNTTATFSAAGTYAFTATISDALGNAVTSSVIVVVNQTLTAITVSPATVTLSANGTQQFTEIAYDQFGTALATQPTVTWGRSAGTGSISSTGLYTAPSTAGTATITATSGSVTGSATVTITSVAPTVATAASATPSPVTGTTTALSVLGADSNGESVLTYTWSATTVPNGVTAPTFSINGTNAAKNTVATFYAVGTYQFTVSISDASGNSTTSSVAVTVNQTLSSIVITPASVRLDENQTEAFGAVGDDQFGAAMATQPAVTWSVIAGAGSINISTGAYTAPGSPGSATVQASSGSVYKTAAVTIVNGAPTVVTPAAASPSVVGGTTTALSVLGADDGGESSLTYTWAAAVIPAGAAAPVFTINGTNASKNTTATFKQAGNYTFTVTITDAGGQTVTSSAAVTVVQTLTGITVSPAAEVVPDGQSYSFNATAVDQFGIAMPSQPSVTWSVDTGGLGTIDQGGTYTAPASGAGTDTVRATCGSLSGTATVTIGLSVINGSSGNDIIRLVRGGTGLASLLVYFDNASTPLYTVPFSSLGSGLTINDGAGNDSVTFDSSTGASPIPAAGVTVNGGGGTDSLVVTGTTGADTTTVNAASVTFDGGEIDYDGISSIVLNGDGGADTFTQAAQPGDGATLAVNGTVNDGPSASDTLNVNAGTFAFPAPAAGGGIRAIPLLSLSIGAGAKVSVGTAASASDRWVLATGALSLADGTSSLDLGGNDMIVRNDGSAGLTNITGELASGRTVTGAWNGPGISSSQVTAAGNGLMSLGVILNGANFTTFDNQSVSPSDVLVKYTYVGDANLDGKVDGSDYTLIDNGYAGGATGWGNGDFNYDGVVDGSDYSLIDNAYNTQGAPVTTAAKVVPAAVVAVPTGVVAKPATVAVAKPAAPVKQRPVNAAAALHGDTPIAFAPAETSAGSVAIAASLTSWTDSIDKLDERPIDFQD